MIKNAVKKQDQAFLLPPFSKSPDFTKSPFRYPGGKFYALKFILPFIDAIPHDEFREPFVGGGSIFFGKKKAKINWVNDLEKNLITTYQVIADERKSKKLIAMIGKELATKERHREIKNLEFSDDLGIAYKTYYLNRTSYCGIIHAPAWGYADGKSSPPSNWAKFIREAHVKLENVKITSYDFEKIVTAPSQSKSVLVYLDPPYFHADQKRAYTKSFKTEDHVRVEEVLRATPHHFCLSYDDCPEIRELYKWANIYERSWLYNTANKSDQSRAMGNELIITNYDVLSH